MTFVFLIFSQHTVSAKHALLQPGLEIVPKFDGLCLHQGDDALHQRLFLQIVLKPSLHRRIRGLVVPGEVVKPGGSVRGERANFTWLVLGCIEAKFCK